MINRVQFRLNEFCSFYQYNIKTGLTRRSLKHQWTSLSQVKQKKSLRKRRDKQWFAEKKRLGCTNYTKSRA